MKSKVSNAIADLAHEKLNRIKELSDTKPELKSTASMVRQIAHEFNARYYRPESEDDLYELYNDINDFQSSLEQIFEDEFGIPKQRGKHYTMSVASRIPSMKVKVKDFSF